jgi:hypothetical protein
LWTCHPIARPTRRRCIRIKLRTIWRRCIGTIKLTAKKKSKWCPASKARLYLRKCIQKPRSFKRSTIRLTIIT